MGIVERLTRNRITPPPRVLPLLALGFAALQLVAVTVAVALAMVELVSAERDVLDAVLLAAGIVYFVLASWLLRYMVRWWLEYHPPPRAGGT